MGPLIALLVMFTMDFLAKVDSLAFVLRDQHTMDFSDSQTTDLCFVCIKNFQVSSISTHCPSMQLSRPAVGT